MVLGKQFLIICIILLGNQLSADSWRVFFYMDATDRLADMAFKNITDMMQGAPAQSVEWYIQLHVYGQVALRYRVVGNDLHFIEEKQLTGIALTDFVDALAWGFCDTHADHTMLILANHGWGALDPSWNDVANAWEAAEIIMTHDGPSCSFIEQQLHAVKKKKQYNDHYNKHRGFMFNNSNKTYVRNDDMSDGLAILTESILHKKLDIIAFDTCMGCMFEIAQCVKPYAHYLLGVQSCALSDGFDYQRFVSILNESADARTTAVQFVDAFDAYYREHDVEGIYTCTALDLSFMDEMTTQLDTIVTILLKHPNYMPWIRAARDASPRFCLWPIYTDLVAFLKLVEAELIEHYAIQDGDGVLSKLRTFSRTMQRAVVARCGGHTTVGSAYGVSIYLPWLEVDAAYSASRFAQQSPWIKLLHAMCD